jgi:FAD/FMN-containing dehydrogenase
MANITTEGIRDLKAALAGTVSTPGESRYDEAVNIWNGAIRRRPAVVASCATSGDVAAALAFARSAGLEVSVRGGGTILPASHSPRAA